MISSYYIKEGQTLVLSAGNHCHHIAVEDHTRAFCEAIYPETAHPVSRCQKCLSWIPVDQEERICETCKEDSA
jgi:hypothetical protein